MVMSPNARFFASMKWIRKVVLAALACFAAGGLAGFIVSNWYLWHLASRVPDPARGLVHPRTLGTTAEFGQQFTVYLSSTESVLLWEEPYVAISAAASILLLPFVWWNFPSRSNET